MTLAGATTYVGHVAEQVAGADLVVRSSAIPDDNPEVQYSLAHGIPVLKRSAFLSELTQGQDVIAVAGTHGKTTTTAMLIWMLTEMGSGTQVSSSAAWSINWDGTPMQARATIL